MKGGTTFMVCKKWSKNLENLMLCVLVIMIFGARGAVKTSKKIKISTFSLCFSLSLSGCYDYMKIKALTMHTV